MEIRTVARKHIRVVMYARGLTTKELAQKANLSVSHTRNLISGVYSCAPGRKKIEDALGLKIWSDQAPEATAAQADLGEQSPVKDMDTKTNQFAGANNAGTGSPGRNS